jgi:hypothetical protein
LFIQKKKYTDALSNNIVHGLNTLPDEMPSKFVYQFSHNPKRLQVKSGKNANNVETESFAICIQEEHITSLATYFGPSHNIGPAETEPQIDGKENAEQRHNTALEPK